MIPMRRNQTPLAARGGPIGRDLVRLAKFGAVTEQAAHALLYNNPSLGQRSAQDRLGLALETAPSVLLEAVSERLSAQYADLQNLRAQGRTAFPLGYDGSAIQPSPGDADPVTAGMIIDEVERAAGPTDRRIPGGSIDLIGERRWSVRNQNGFPTCVAYAALACAELKRARESSDPRAAPIRLSARYLYRRMREEGFNQNIQGPIWKGGGVKFQFGLEVMESPGLIDEAAYLDFFEAADASSDRKIFEAVRSKPPQTALSGLTYYRCAPALYEDLKVARPPGMAMRLYHELQSGRAIAVAIPGFADPAAPTRNIWHYPDFWLTGLVPTPLPTQIRTNYGHAVCVTGFLPNNLTRDALAEDGFGGYFVFRNSWGDKRFGVESPVGLPPGYGLIPASVIEYFVWEAVSA